MHLRQILTTLFSRSAPVPQKTRSDEAPSALPEKPKKSAVPPEDLPAQETEETKSISAILTEITIKGFPDREWRAFGPPGATTYRFVNHEGSHKAGKIPLVQFQILNEAFATFRIALTKAPRYADAVQPELSHASEAELAAKKDAIKAALDKSLAPDIAMVFVKAPPKPPEPS